MNFAEPYWLFVGIAACLGLTVLFRHMQKRRQAALEKFAAQQLIGRLTRNVSGRRRRYKNILLLLAVLFCFAALARPQYGFKWVDIKRKGIDLLFALDTSKSMLAEDIKPNRLTRAHLAILDFVQQLDGDRVGLMPFAGSAYLMCPLTLDYEAFEDSLAAVTTDIIPRGGTNIGSVVNLAMETLNNGANHKILIVLTDGENLEGDAVKAADEAAKQGLTIYTVGVGTSQGELIPMAGESGRGFVKDKRGNFITSRLDETVLATIAEKSGGMYVPLGPAGEGLETIYQQKLALIPKEELAERRHKVPQERFEWPLAAALLCLVLELLVGERRKVRSLSLKKTIRRFRPRDKKAAEVAAVILLLALGSANKAYCSAGEEAFARGDYLQAAEYYRGQLEKFPNDPQLLYNFGTSSFKNNMYDDAIAAFSKALTSDDIRLQEKAYYNRGNSLYQKGAEALQGDPQATIGHWQQALTSLEAALELDPDNEDARHNHAVIKKRLEELEKQQQNRDNKQDQQQNSDGEEQKQDSDQQQTTSDQQQSDANGHQSDDGQPGEQPDQNPQDQKDNTEQTAPEQNNTAENQPRPQNAAGGETNKPDQQTDEDAARQQLGKMTREEAEKMLNALKNEEGELNFVPSGTTNQNDVEKDW